MSRKLLSDPYRAIHGKKMAKKGHLFMEFWPIFDIFHGLRPYLCSKAQDLGFHKQSTHRRRGHEPFFTLWSTLHDWGWPKKGPFWTKNGQTGLSTWSKWSKRAKKRPKWPPQVFLTIWAHLDHFGPFQRRSRRWWQLLLNEIFSQKLSSKW